MANNQLRISSLYIYPIKSLSGVSVAKCAMGTTGFQFDRRWMLVDSDGKFMSQRQFPQLALISLTLEKESIKLDFPNKTQCKVPLVGEPGEEVQVHIWRDQCVAYGGYDQLNGYFSDFLKIDCHLVYMPEQTRRIVDQRFASTDSDQVSFADGFPYLLVTEESLAELNGRLIKRGHTPIPITRFRPNIVLSGASAAHAEDTWDRLEITGSLFTVAKPCSRCVMITVDSEQGIHTKEPLQTLLSYRKQNGKVYFGQNLIYQRKLSENSSKVEQVRVNDLVRVQAFK